MKIIKTGRMFIALASVLFLSGCATSFTGSAHMTPAKCENQCRDWGMQLEGMVAMGEYSSACVCKKHRPARSQSSVDDLSGYEGSIAAVETFLRAMRQSAGQQSLGFGM